LKSVTGASLFLPEGAVTRADSFFGGDTGAGLFLGDTATGTGLVAFLGLTGAAATGELPLPLTLTCSNVRCTGRFRFDSVQFALFWHFD
jgi:hypothetical protein